MNSEFCNYCSLKLWETIPNLYCSPCFFALYPVFTVYPESLPEPFELEEGGALILQPTICHIPCWSEPFYPNQSRKLQITQQRQVTYVQCVFPEVQSRVLNKHEQFCWTRLAKFFKFSQFLCLTKEKVERGIQAPWALVRQQMNVH